MLTSRLTLLDYLDGYALSRTIAPETLEQYRVAVRLFARHNGAEYVDELCDDAVNRWLRDYAETVSPNTAKSRRRTILTIWRAAHDDGHLTSKPQRVRPIRRRETPRDTWTAAEVGAIARACLKIPGYLPTGQEKGPYFAAWVAVAWDTGLRLGDIADLPATVASKGTEWWPTVQHKTGSLRWCRFNSSTLELLARFATSGPLFVKWRTGSRRDWLRAVSDIVALMMKDAGLSASDGPFKKLRRSSITAVELAAPGTGYHQAGHARPDTTIRHYLNPTLPAVNRIIPPELG